MSKKNNEQRNAKIRDLYLKKKLTLKDIGEKYSISQERVRQIIHNKNTVRRNVLEELKDKYKKKFNDKITQKNLLEDIERLSKKSRKREDVVERDFLISYLHDELEIPFLKIGILLHRDHTSIIHAYYKK